ncbi:hypothetical protein A0H81_07344 [Grifola frondosa]|uniref:Uncharacterized protein n=1 Tax=Grifola frondosa TaxID=5627 RepID=A0A1C7M5V8_GRIFR|nr:hypothetical protein A0H81_07344 [Grifola frondosa]
MLQSIVYFQHYSTLANEPYQANAWHSIPQSNRWRVESHFQSVFHRFVDVYLGRFRSQWYTPKLRPSRVEPGSALPPVSSKQVIVLVPS